MQLADQNIFAQEQQFRKFFVHMGIACLVLMVVCMIMIRVAKQKSSSDTWRLESGYLSSEYPLTTTSDNQVVAISFTADIGYVGFYFLSFDIYNAKGEYMFTLADEIWKERDDGGLYQKKKGEVKFTLPDQGKYTIEISKEYQVDQVKNVELKVEKQWLSALPFYVGWPVLLVLGLVLLELGTQTIKRYLNG